MEVLEEQVQVVLAAWGPGPFSFSGSHYRLVGLDAFPKPVQQPHPPLIIGGSGGPRSVALAARYADEYNTTFASVEEIRERRLRVGQACEAAGRDPIPFSLMTGFLVGRDRDELLERARRLGLRIGFTDAEAFLADPPAAWIVGTVDEAVQQLQAIAAAGASRVMCQHLLHDDLEAVALLGSELAPRLA
jgi:alkanesulfonate monooxygenase SsuD/methylene tetrahydromethanopterin reductase-like flavin-dependent oxidoreductase (luciferase family)